MSLSGYLQNILLFKNFHHYLNLNFINRDKEGKGEAASFLKKLGDCDVREGKTAKFTACVTGSPKPEIKW